MAYTKPVDQKTIIQNIYDYKRLLNNYKTYCSNVTDNIIDLGFPALQRSFRGLRKQELMTIIAKSGIGKSILTMNLICNYLLRSKELAVIFSLEMSAFSITERLLQLALLEKGEDIEEAFVKQDKQLISNAESVTNYDKKLFIVPARIDVAEIPDYIDTIEKEIKNKVGLVGIDYVGLLNNKYYPGDEYYRISDNMRRLYGYAKQLNVGIINVSQVSREDAKQGLGLHSAKGSGEVENSSDFLITFEEVTQATLDDAELAMLHFVQKSKKPYRLMKIVTKKTRRGQPNQSIYALLDTETVTVVEYDVSIL